MASESSFLLPHWTSCPPGLRHREVEFWLVFVKVQQPGCRCCYPIFKLWDLPPTALSSGQHACIIFWNSWAQTSAWRSTTVIEITGKELHFLSPSHALQFYRILTMAWVYRIYLSWSFILWTPPPPRVNMKKYVSGTESDPFLSLKTRDSQCDVSR